MFLTSCQASFHHSLKGPWQPGRKRAKSWIWFIVSDADSLGEILFPPWALYRCWELPVRFRFQPQIANACDRGRLENLVKKMLYPAPNVLHALITSTSVPTSLTLPERLPPRMRWKFRISKLLHIKKYDFGERVLQQPFFVLSKIGFSSFPFSKKSIM